MDEQKCRWCKKKLPNYGEYNWESCPDCMILYDDIKENFSTAKKMINLLSAKKMIEEMEDNG